MLISIFNFFVLRKRRLEVKTALKALIEKKGKIQTMNYNKTWNDLKEASDVVSLKPRIAKSLLKLS